jgi:hypothetical protein
MPFSYISAGLGINQALGDPLGLTGKHGGGGTSQQYDPYSPYRAEAAGQLRELMSDPGKAFSQPGYQTQLQMGQESVNRGMAATGQLQSGAEQIALQNLGQNTFSSYYNNMLANLMQLSGASQSPAAAGKAQTDANLANMAMKSAGFNNLNSAVGTLGGVYGSSGGGVSAYDNANAWYNSNFNSVADQPLTGDALQTAQDFYGNSFNPNAGFGGG